MQREEPPTMATGLERIAAKARCEPKLRFTSLAHHITKERVWENLCQIRKDSAPGVDGQTVPEAKESFGEWIDPMLQSIHRQGYQAPNIRRVYIPKPGKQEKRPLGVPCVADRALQRSTAQVLSAIYEQDFLPCSFGGRPERGAHQALATLHEVIAGRKVEWVLEADLKNFFGSLSHEWMLRFVEHRVGDPRLINLIRRWLKAGVLEDGEVHPNEEGTPQGGSITPLTQKVISSSKGQSRAGEQGTRCLTSVLRGNMCMTYDALDQSGKGSATECRSWPTPASCCFARSSPAVVTRVRSVRAPSLSVPGGSVPARSTGRSDRAYGANHVEASAEHGGTAAEVREKQWPDHWSDCDRRVERVSAHSKKAWLSRVKKAAHCKSTFPIRLIACSSRSSRRLMTFWFRVASAPSAYA